MKGTFWYSQLQFGKKMYIKIPKGVEKFYDEHEVLLLEGTSYGSKQAAMDFWKNCWKLMYKHVMKGGSQPMHILQL